MTDQPIQINSPTEIEHAKQEMAKMTPGDYIGMTTYIKELEGIVDSMNLPEAGGIAFTELINEDGVKVNITARGTTPEEAFDKLMDAINHAKVEFDFDPVARVKTFKAVPQEEGGESQIPMVDMTGDTTEAAPAVTINGVMEIAEVEVTPMVGNRATMKFYAAGHKYPDLYINNWPVDSLHQKLSAVGGAGIDLTKAYRGTVNWRVSWKEGKQMRNSDKHYKDVVDIQPAS